MIIYRQGDIMNVKVKMRDLTLKNTLLLVSYIALLILALVNFHQILSFFGTLMSVLGPFIIGIVLAFIFNIPMKIFERKLPIENKRIKKNVSAILAILLIISVVSLILVVALPQLIENIRTFANNLPELMEQVEELGNHFFERLNIVPMDVIEKIRTVQESFGQKILDYLSTWAPSIAVGVTNVTSSILHFFIGFIMSIYILFSKDKLMRQVKKLGQALLNDQQLEYAIDLIHLISNTFENFLAGQLTESLIIGVLCYTGCLILDIPYGFIAAFVIGCTNIIPYFGPILGALISCVLIFLVSPVKALVFLIFSTLLQQFESHIIYPHVVGSSVGLSALWVLLAVSVGGGLFGIPGMIFGLPTFSVVYELLRRWTNQRIIEKQICSDEHTHQQ